MNKYKIPMKYRHPNGIRNLLLVIGIALALYGLWWSCQSARVGYQIYTQHKALVMAANEQRDNAMTDVILAMEMLSGKRPVMTADGLRVAEITWQDVELIRRLK